MRSSVGSWVKTLTKLGFRSSNRRASKFGKSSTRLGFESLEDRRLLATLTVQTDIDGINGDSMLSLREAIEIANNPGAAIAGQVSFDEHDTIVFDGALQNATIDLTGGELSVTQSVTIDAQAFEITIDALDSGSRIFKFGDFGSSPFSIDAVIDGLTLTRAGTQTSGRTGHLGGAIASNGSLTVRNSTITGSEADEGGAIYAVGSLTIQDSTIEGNESRLDGGGVVARRSNSYTQSSDDPSVARAVLTIENSVLRDNEALYGEGGGIHAVLTGNSSVEIRDSTIDQNDANGDGGGVFVVYEDGEYRGYSSAGVKIERSSLTGNTSGDDGGGAFVGLGGENFGLGFHHVAPSLTFEMSTSTVTDNSAFNRGGGLLLYGAGGSDLKIQDSLITGNKAGIELGPSNGENPHSGGGVYTYMVSGPDGQFFSENKDPSLVTKLTIAGTTIAHNVAGHHAGGVFICTKRGGRLSSEFALSNSTISNNRAGMTTPAGEPGTGGGLHLAVADFPEDEGLVSDFRNVTITENTAGTGAGVYSDVPSFNGNSSFPASVTDTRMKNMIIAGNENHSGVANNFYGSINAAETDYNVFGAGNTFFEHHPTAVNPAPGKDMISFSDLGPNNDDLSGGNDPGLHQLAASGGTILPGRGALPVHVPKSGSPVLGAGNDDFAAEPFTELPLVNDQRGLASSRIVNTVDAGAVERQGLDSKAIIVDLPVDESDGNHNPGDLSLREALIVAASLSGKNTIRFAESLFFDVNGDPSPWVLTLTEGQLVVDSNVTIDGRGAEMLAISGDGNSRVMEILDDVAATIENVTLADGNGLSAGGGGGNDGFGGALYSEGNLTLDGVEVRDSSSTSDGGGIYTGGGQLFVVNSTIAENNSGSRGGGLFLRNTDAAVVNSTVSTNTSSSLGGVVLVGSSVSPGNLLLVNATITHNTSEGDYAGGFVRFGHAAVEAHNTIFAENYSLGGATIRDVYFRGGAFDPSSSNNLFTSSPLGGLTSGVNGNLLVTPTQIALSALGDHGGSTRTHKINSSASVAVDHGDNARAAAFDRWFEQRGEDRFVDGDNDNDLLVDVGAVEYYFGDMV